MRRLRLWLCRKLVPPGYVVMEDRRTNKYGVLLRPVPSGGTWTSATFSAADSNSIVYVWDSSLR